MFSCKALTPKVYTPHGKKRVSLSPSATSSSLPPSPALSLSKLCLWNQKPTSESPGQSKCRFLGPTQGDLGGDLGGA